MCLTSESIPVRFLCLSNIDQDNDSALFEYIMKHLSMYNLYFGVELLADLSVCICRIQISITFHMKKEADYRVVLIKRRIAYVICGLKIHNPINLQGV